MREQTIERKQGKEIITLKNNYSSFEERHPLFRAPNNHSKLSTIVFFSFTGPSGI